jgi:medium-chain acyl-[acyl-carrier-protein] hydrolase
MDQLTNDRLILESKYSVTSADTDMEARIRLGAFVNLLIQSAINSAENLGFGFGGIRQQKLFWVLSRLTLEIYKPLTWQSNTVVETWPKDIDGLLYLRDFMVFDDRKDCVAKATSGWLAIDLDSKRPKLIDGLQGDVFVLLKEKNALAKLPVKLAGITDGDIFEIKSTYCDLDLNKHVTSTRYIDWMIDTLSIEFLQKNYPKSLSINYMKETMPGETIRIIRKQEEYHFHFEGFNVGKNTVAFRGYIEF